MGYYWQIAAFNRICGRGSTEALKAFNAPLDFLLCSLSHGFSSDILFFEQSFQTVLIKGSGATKVRLPLKVKEGLCMST